MKLLISIIIIINILQFWHEASAGLCLLFKSCFRAGILVPFGKFKNIELFYLGDVMDEAIANYPGPKSDLIEPTDGFHPNQLAQALFASFMWNATVAAGIVPPVNPNNEAIKKKFFPGV